MHFPQFLSIKSVHKVSKRDDKVFAEARELALLRLEQCIADLRLPPPTTGNETKPLGTSADKQPHDLVLGSFAKRPGSQCVPTPVLNSGPTGTATEKIINSLRASSGRLMRVTFSDGVVQTVIIDTTDDKGFLHRDGRGIDPQLFWTRFEHVSILEPEAPHSNYSRERPA